VIHLLIILGLVALSWVVALGLFWVAVFVSPWIPLGIVATLVVIAVPQRTSDWWR
jgi:hypothetical protein